MSEHPTDDAQLKALMTRETDRLSPDLHSIVDGSMADGRALLRRRRVRRGAGVAGLAVLAVVAAPFAGQLVGGQDRPTARDLTVAAQPTAQPTAEPTTPADPSTTALEPRRRLAVAPQRITGTFTHLAPGTVTEESTKEANLPSRDFLWDGYRVSVGFQRLESILGAPIGERLARHSELRVADLYRACERTGAAGEDVEVSDCAADEQGNVVRLMHVPVGTEVLNSASVYTPDGWAITVSATNFAQKESGTVLSAQPPFTAQQLLDVALDPVWFGN